MTDFARRWGAIRAPRVLLDENEIGYCMQPDRRDDSLRAAISTVLQVPIDRVPDQRLNERLAVGEDPVAVRGAQPRQGGDGPHPCCGWRWEA